MVAVTAGVTTTMAGQVIVAVKAAGLGPGVATCAQLSVAVCAAACGVQVNPMAGGLAPTVAGAAMVRVPPEATAKAAVPAGIVQVRPSDAAAIPAVATFTGTEPAPPVKVVPTSGLAVGAVGTGATKSAKAAAVPGTPRISVPVADSRRFTDVPANAAVVVNETVASVPAALVGQAAPKSVQTNSTYESVTAFASPFSESGSKPLSP